MLKDLKNTDEVIDFFTDMLSDDKLGNKVQLARLYGLAKRQQEDDARFDFIREDMAPRNRSNRIVDFHFITDELIIVEMRVDYVKKDKNVFVAYVNKKKSFFHHYSFIDALLFGIGTLYANDDKVFEYMLKLIGKEPDTGE